MECVSNCGFLRFGNGSFNCKFYDTKLTSEQSIDLETPDRVIIYRCDKCVEEGEIGTNTIKEDARKLKQHIGWMMDSFYSFKDDMESEITNLYGILKTLEERSEDKQMGKDKNF